MFRKVLLPIDGSSLSSKLTQAAMECARLARGEVVALAVTHPNQLSSTGAQSIDGGKIPTEAVSRENAQVFLEPVIRAARMANVRCDTVIVQSSVVSQAILDIAKHYYCDAIFMPSQGSPGMPDEPFNTSEAYKVLEQSPIPVLIIR